MRMIGKAILIAILLAAVSLCGHKLWRISSQYTEEAQIKDELSRYRPELPIAQIAKEAEIKTPDASAGIQDQQAGLTDAAMNDDSDQSGELTRVVNRGIIDMQEEINRDVIGWLTIPNTKIDYPFVIAQDNDFYLRRNIYKKQAAAGSIFMDYRCARDLSDSNTIIYGHNMKNRSMFGELRLFADRGFFESNVSGTLFVADNTYALEIFAYMVVRADDKRIYDPSADREELLEYARKNARQFREPSAAGNIVTLSTCAYEFSSARMVLLAVITQP